MTMPIPGLALRGTGYAVRVIGNGTLIEGSG